MRQTAETNSWIVMGIMAIVIQGCSAQLKQHLNVTEQEEEPVEKSEQIVPGDGKGPEWLIADAQAKQLINAIPPGEVLAVVVRPGFFAQKGLAFPAVFHESNRQQFMFALQEAMQDAAQYLQDYYRNHPGGSGMQLVPITDTADFGEIACKTSPGAGGRKAEVRGRLMSLDEFFGLTDSPYPWSRICCKSWMQDAVRCIPRQDDLWSCGVNSAGKAIHLFGENMSEDRYRDSFLANAPTVLNCIERGCNMTATAINVSPWGYLFPFAASAISREVRAVGTAVRVSAYATFSSDSGITPADLAAHTTHYLPGSKRARHCSYDSFWDCAKVVRDDIRRGDPVIVLWIFSWKDAHYVNVVGVSVDSSDLPEEFVIMDTNHSRGTDGYENCLKRYSWRDMRHLMEREYVSWATILGSTDDYHIIRFYR
ncbi:MAG: hypothetical protein ROO73_04520 [Roseivirga sp.]